MYSEFFHDVASCTSHPWWTTTTPTTYLFCCWSMLNEALFVWVLELFCVGVVTRSQCVCMYVRARARARQPVDAYVSVAELEVRMRF